MVAEVARAKGILAVADNTFASPWVQRPLEHGFDIVVHSATKYLNGHSDLIGGVAVTSSKEIGEKLTFLQNAIGSVPSAFDCFLVTRGLKTLALRMQRHCENALAIAQWLGGHAKIERVFYPGLKSHPQRALAKRQMAAGGGMVSAIVKGGEKAALRFHSSIRRTASSRFILGSNRFATFHCFAISSRLVHTPTARPARYAAPSAVVSRTHGRTTGMPRRSAWNCMRRSSAAAPPSTRSSFDFRPESCSMACRRSADWKAIDSKAAHAMWPALDPRVSPTIVPRAYGSQCGAPKPVKAGTR